MTLSNNLLAQLDSPSGLPEKNCHQIICIQIDGFFVYVGKNSFSNERLISEHKEKHPKCLWLHALSAGGSHVVICIDGKENVPESVIHGAGKFAIEYSRSRGITARLARLEALFKPEGAGIGIWRAEKFTTLEVRI